MILAVLIFATRIVANQIQGIPLAMGTNVTVNQAAKLTPDQLPGNVIVLVMHMTDADTGAQSDVPVATYYPPEQWCTPEDMRICPQLTQP